jgi:hypothetical protein
MVLSLAIGLAFLATTSLLIKPLPSLHINQRPGASPGTTLGLLLIPLTFTSLQTNISNILVYFAFLNSFALAGSYSKYRGTALFAIFSIVYLIKVEDSVDISAVMMPCLVSLISTIVVFRSLLYYLPRNFTIGEAMILSNIISLLLGDAVKCTMGSEVVSPFRIFLLSLILGMIFIGVAAYYPILRPLRSFCSVENKSTGAGIKRIVYSLAFHAFAIAIILVVISPWTRIFLPNNTEPFEWALNYIFTDTSHERPILFFTWLIVIILGLLLASHLFSLPAKSSIDLNMRRKYYHAIAVAIFIPGYLLDVRVLFSYSRPNSCIYHSRLRQVQ